MPESESPYTLFPYACPCCGYNTLGCRGDWDICPICWWEDDGQDNWSADQVNGGPNSHLSLSQARVNFLRFGISDPQRDDLRNKQKDTRLFDRQRMFLFDSESSKLSEPATGWSTLVCDSKNNLD